MIELIQYFDNAGRVFGLVVIMVVFFGGLGHVAGALRGGDKDQ